MSQTEVPEDPLIRTVPLEGLVAKHIANLKLARVIDQNDLVAVEQAVAAASSKEGIQVLHERSEIQQCLDGLNAARPGMHFRLTEGRGKNADERLVSAHINNLRLVKYDNIHQPSHRQAILANASSPNGLEVLHQLEKLDVKQENLEYRTEVLKNAEGSRMQFYKDLAKRIASKHGRG